jgi:hypothetical protein
MKDNDIKILQKNGWTLVSESPLEIFHETTGSKVSGAHAVVMILDYLDEYGK